MGMNATMINQQADDETAGQRKFFQFRFNDLTSGGASRDLSSLFPEGPLSNPAESFDKTKDAFTGLYTNGIVVGTDIQPDFEKGHSANDYKYRGSELIKSGINDAEDKPSIKGPNLKSISIGRDGQPILEGITSSDVSPPVDTVNGRGFGTKNDRNFLQNSKGVTSHYVDRKDESKVTFGEYIDITNYFDDIETEE